MVPPSQIRNSWSKKDQSLRYNPNAELLSESKGPSSHAHSNCLKNPSIRAWLWSSSYSLISTFIDSTILGGVLQVAVYISLYFYLDTFASCRGKWWTNLLAQFKTVYHHKLYIYSIQGNNDGHRESYLTLTWQEQEGVNKGCIRKLLFLFQA